MHQSIIQYRQKFRTRSFGRESSNCLVNFQFSGMMHYSLYTCLNLIIPIWVLVNMIKVLSLDNRMQWTCISFQQSLCLCCTFALEFAV